MKKNLAILMTTVLAAASLAACGSSSTPATTTAAATEAATTAAAAHVRQLIIGHFSARYDEEELLLNEARAIFPNTVLAAEGKTFEVIK